MKLKDKSWGKRLELLSSHVFFEITLVRKQHRSYIVVEKRVRVSICVYLYSYNTIVPYTLSFKREFYEHAIRGLLPFSVCLQFFLHDVKRSRKCEKWANDDDLYRHNVYTRAVFEFHFYTRREFFFSFQINIIYLYSAHVSYTNKYNVRMCEQSDPFSSISLYTKKKLAQIT